MLVKNILNTTKISFSFEFFPPKSENAWEKLFLTISDLMPLKPSWVSVTYGAGGSTRDRTNELVVRIQNETNLTVVSHLTCVGSNREEVDLILESYAENGMENILALKGDPQAGPEGEAEKKDDFPHAADLVSFIKRHYPHICVGVAGFPEGHPDTPNRLMEIEYLKAKIDAGADYIITQLFFDNRDFYDFCERCELAGIHVPIIAGIMPVVTRRGMIRMAEIAAGSRFPAGLLKSVALAKSDDYVEKVGLHWATEQVRDLIGNNVRGIHFYTLNDAKAPLDIYGFLGVKDSSQFSGTLR